MNKRYKFWGISNSCAMNNVMCLLKVPAASSHNLFCNGRGVRDERDDRNRESKRLN